ncbi:MAG: hypothetical protein ACLP6G_08410 [Terriglobales bacterium]
MLSLSLAWHIVWFTRVILSLALFIVIIKCHLYKQYLLFAVHSGWIAVAGIVLVAMNYVSFVSGNQYFAGTAISNGVEAALAFAIIYQIFAERARYYPAASSLGVVAFRATTLICVAIAIALAWFAPAQGPDQPTSIYAVIQRTVRTLQCGQLIFLFLFCAYFRLSWRSRTFGIALGLCILTSSSLATNAIYSQIAAGRMWNLGKYTLALLSDSTYLVAVLVWLSYLLAPEPTPQLIDATLPDHDLETWNRELERLLEP